LIYSYEVGRGSTEEGYGRNEMELIVIGKVEKLS